MNTITTTQLNDRFNTLLSIDNRATKHQTGWGYVDVKQAHVPNAPTYVTIELRSMFATEVYHVV